MTIKDYKDQNIFPIYGTIVRTEMDPNFTHENIFVNKAFLASRRDGMGTFVGFVAGSNSKLWYIGHEDMTIGAYMSTEVF